jgi:hypothetical protein
MERMKVMTEKIRVGRNSAQKGKTLIYFVSSFRH